ncbi:uncharacterized protein LOC117641568 [Thrips palmi]|uniref:Uncharacterized protein LOC117641568 n=1 Tax=Thrips palmi TaxID=161013 RepID=A0A6P8ZJ85_THRPL|nr:uncharacterized protein LOC117641568 [Thrips palmi]
MASEFSTANFPESEKPYQGTKYRKTTTCAFLSALKNLCTAADQFWESYKQEARKLVQSKTSEVKKLYEQYKTMTEELRMKWRSTSENIQRINVPISSLTEN